MNDDSTPPTPGPDTPQPDTPELDTPEGAISEDEQRSRDALRRAPAPTLSDLERRRLVRGAMEATAPASNADRSGTALRRWMAAGAAAAVLVLVVVSISWLAGRSTDAQFADAGGESADAPVEGDQAESAESNLREVELVDLGALGNFEDAAAVVIAFDNAGLATTGSSDTPLRGFVASTDVACSDLLPADFLPLAVGTLTLSGSDAVIFGGEMSDGATVAYLLDASECTPFDGWDPRPL